MEVLSASQGTLTETSRVLKLPRLPICLLFELVSYSICWLLLSTYVHTRMQVYRGVHCVESPYYLVYILPKEQLKQRSVGRRTAAWTDDPRQSYLLMGFPDIPRLLRTLRGDIWWEMKS